MRSLAREFIILTNFKKNNHMKKQEFLNLSLSDKQDLLRDFVRQNVDRNQSYLVSDLLSKEVLSYDDIVNGYPPIDEAERDQRIIDMKKSDAETGENPCATDDDYFNWATDECEDNREPEEIFEWWLVSDWLLSRLEAKGEPILKTDFESWWGRTCTGQAVFMDSVIESIYLDLFNE